MKKPPDLDLWVEIFYQTLKDFYEKEDKRHGHSALMFTLEDGSEAFGCILARGSERQVQTFMDACDRISHGVASSTGQNVNRW